ncbi:MAG: hypothetical protein H8E37_03445 [Planctomycetes bacterium]|nr:hypothetical protein [Planctomycetota bacterium]
MRILYCGDTTLDTAAAYLASLICHWDWDLTYVPSDQPFASSLLERGDTAPVSVFIFSDYPAAQISVDLQHRTLQHVSNGAGLVMLGGWESFHGLGGDWDSTPIGDALPVEISSSDDRVNCDRPVLVDATKATHPVTASLPWAARPPVIGGFNRLVAKPESDVLLEAVTHSAERTPGGFELHETRRDPLLITGRYGEGRTLALATDVAPHWVGPLVDWGDDRVNAAAPGIEGVEVGNLYATFLRQMLEWAAGDQPR